MTVHRSWTLDRLVEEYTQHQRRTRGLRPRTLRGRARLVQMLVRAALGEDPVEPTRLAPADVVAFITSLRGRFSPASMQTVRSTLRSFFRFLRFQGFCGDELEAALPAVAHWRLAALPRALTDQQVGEVLASFDAPRPCRQRDHAIVQCLSTLGPSALTLSDLDAPMVLSFLDHLESERGNSARTRNLRLAAIRSFMRYASLREPTLLPVTQRVLAIPAKCFDRPVLGYLSRGEVTAIINAPDPSTWSGQRDAVLFAVLYNTGARVSEITRLRVDDVLLDRASAVLLHGKGRKERAVPLWKSTAAQLRRWLPRIDRSPDRPVFPNRTGQPLSRSGVEHQLRVACRKASERHPSLATRRISPHTLRHTTAMHLLQSGVDDAANL